MCATNHSEILHMPRQLHCYDVCKILLWSAEYVINKSITKFHYSSNLIKILLVGWAHDQDMYFYNHICPLTSILNTEFNLIAVTDLMLTQLENTP